LRAAGAKIAPGLESGEQIGGLRDQCGQASWTPALTIEEHLKNSLQVAGGVVGAVIGFVATLLLLELVGFGDPADPIMSGMLALLVFAPAGAIGGLVIGTVLATQLRGGQSGDGLLRSSLKASAVLIGLCPNAPNPLLVFEVRLPAGAVLPSSAREITAELHTDLNTMPGEMQPDQFRRDGERPVIAGYVELAFRTATRRLEISIKGQPDRLYLIGLSAKAPHSREFGPWQANRDGSEIRYRARWPGQS
jgi:hypothetical protein